RKRARRSKRGILAKRVTGDEGNVAGHHKASLFLENAHHRHRHGHQSGLSVFGKRQRFLRAFPHDGGKLLPERVVNFLEHGPGWRERIGERFTHADVLTALARKDESARHEYWGPYRFKSTANRAFVLIVAALVHRLSPPVKARPNER